MPQDSAVPSTGPSTTAQPTTQAAIVVKPMITLVVAAAHAKVSPMATTLEKTAPMAEKNLPPNPKKTPMVILEEEV